MSTTPGGTSATTGAKPPGFPTSPPFPSVPATLLPQQWTLESSLARAHANRHPTATGAMAGMAGTGNGVRSMLGLGEPTDVGRPSWRLSFRPQHQTTPASSIARVVSTPAVTWTIFAGSPTTLIGAG